MRGYNGKGDLMNDEEKNSGWCWHVFHDELFRYNTNWNDRLDTIVKYKALEEQPIRERLMHWMECKLPKAVLDAWNPLFISGGTYSYIDYNKAIEEHREEILALHAKECPDCPWDEEQQTIFPVKKSKNL